VKKSFIASLASLAFPAITRRLPPFANLCAYLCVAILLCLLLAGCQSSQISSRTARVGPDGSTYTTERRASSQSLSWDGVKQVGGALWDSGLGGVAMQAAGIGLGGSGLLGAGLAWLATRSRANRKQGELEAERERAIREAERDAWDEAKRERES
jgi:hypothetical protein